MICRRSSLETQAYGPSTVTQRTPLATALFVLSWPEAGQSSSDQTSSVRRVTDAWIWFCSLFFAQRETNSCPPGSKSSFKLDSRKENRRSKLSLCGENRRFFPAFSKSACLIDFNFNGLRSDLFTLRQMHFQHTIFIVRTYFGTICTFRKCETSHERTVGTLDPMVFFVLLFFFEFPLTADS